ncbi:MAG: anti-sigma factor [Eubacteriales bacterium]|nr:anti-sigma factor [Eubacteriales bacterium]
MSEQEYFEQLCSNSLDGTLTDTEREKLEEHLAGCPSCAALKHDLERMQALFSAEAEPPAGLHADIMRRVQQEAKLRVVRPEKPARRLPVFTMVATAAVVVLVVLGGGLGQLFNVIGAGKSMSAAGGGSTAAEDAAAANGSMAQTVNDAAAQAGLVEQESGDAQHGGGADGGATPETAVNDAGQPDAPQSAVANKNEVQTGGASVRTASGGEDVQDAASPYVMAAESGISIDLPEGIRNASVAHCYLAEGTGEMPDIAGELLQTEGAVSYYLLQNSMSSIENTFATVEEAGYTVEAYEDVGLTIDAKAESWLLIVVSE